MLEVVRAPVTSVSMRFLAIVFVALAPALALAEERVAFATKPGETVLLLDDHVVAKTSKLTQQFFPAQRHPSNPVIRRTERWEGIGPYVWGNRLLQDERTGEFRLWYIGFEPARNLYRWGLATSPDGLNWTKPTLSDELIDGAPARNCLWLGPHKEKGARTIARDPRPTTPPQKRFLGVRFTYDGEYVSFSPDGIHWTEHPGNPVWHVPSDTQHLMWDERRNQFVLYYKLWELKGTEVLASGATRPFVAYTSTFKPTKLTNDTTSFEAPIVHFRKDAPAEVKRETFILRSGNQSKDDGGGSSLSGAWTGKRVQAWARSDDGVHWTDEQVILRADEKDPPTANIQFMFVMPYGGYYLAFLTLHDERGQFRIQLAHSVDGIHWQRPWREPWLDVGPAGAFDSGMVLGPADPIIRQREMWFPYGGFPIHHDSTEQNWESAVGSATTRLDGFAAWRAGAERGELITQPFVCTGDRLFVNANATNGSVKVEVQDENGKPLSGFLSSDSEELKGDTLAGESNGWARWKSQKDLSNLKGQTLRLRVTLQHADLFSFRIADENTVKLRTPRAAMN
jgi:hypothetical protein